MKQVTVNVRESSQPTSLVGSDAKNALPSSTSYNWTDLAGLTWVFEEDYAYPTRGR